MDIIKNFFCENEQASKTQKALALSVSSMLNLMLSIVLQMVLARIYSKTELAIYSQSLFIYRTIVPFLNLGIPSGIYYCLVRSKGRIRAVIIEGILLVSMACAVASLIILIGGNRFISASFHNEALIDTIPMIIPLILLTVPESVAEVTFVFCNRIKLNAIYQVIKSIIISSVLISVSFCQNNGLILFLSRVIVSCVMGLITIAIVFLAIVPKDSFAIKKRDFSWIISLSLPLGLASVAGSISTNLDSWIVSTMLSPEEYAVFQTGAYEIPFIGVITGAISTVVLVEITEAFKSNDYKRAMELFGGVADKTSQFLMPIMVFFFFAGSNFIRFMYTDKYASAIPIFIVYLLYIPIRAVVYGPVLVAIGKSNLVFKRECFGLVINAIVSTVFVFFWGAIGASIATILVVYAYVVPFNLFVISRECKVKWKDILPFRKMLTYIVASIPGGLLCWSIDFILRDALYIIRLGVMFLTYSITTIIVYKKGLNISIFRMVKAIIKR